MADINEDTVPFAVIDDDPTWVVNREDNPPVELPAEVKGKVPEPALIRGVLVAGVGFVSAVVGRQLGADWIDPLIALYVVVAPIGLSLWIRRHVSPVPK